MHERTVSGAVQGVSEWVALNRDNAQRMQLVTAVSMTFVHASPVKALAYVLKR